MAEAILGRTNLVFPPVWLSLSAPQAGVGERDWSQFVEACIRSRVPIDISSSPAFWGGFLRGRDELTLIQVSQSELEQAVDSYHAASLLQSHLLSTLSAIGREYIDFYFLRSKQALEEFQLAGIFEALEEARTQGHIRFLGLWVQGAAIASLANWQFNDAFEVICVDGNRSDLSPLLALAKERRVGVVTRGILSGEAPASQPHLVSVHDEADVDCALSTFRVVNRQ